MGGTAADASIEIVNGGPAIGRDAVVAIVGARLRCEDETATLVCTGTVIAPRVVLTAAHCVADRSAASLEVFLGPDLTAPGAFAYVADVRVASGFDPQTLSNDVALVRLASAAPVKPMSVWPSAVDASLVGTTARIVGYGASAPGDPGGKRLEGAVKIAQLGATQVTVQPQPSLSCNGDSGGPLVLSKDGTDYVAAVASFGDPRCADHAVFARVDPFGASLVQPYVAGAANAPPLPIAAARTGTCDACGGGGDCAAGLFCSPQAPRACGLAGLPAGTLGEACATNAQCGEDACLALGSGTGRACFCYRPCSAADRCDSNRSPLPSLSGHACLAPTAPDSGGCTVGRVLPPSDAALVALIAAFGLARRLRVSASIHSNRGTRARQKHTASYQ